MTTHKQRTYFSMLCEGSLSTQYTILYSIFTLVKYLLWPLLMLILIYLDSNIWHIYNKETYIAMFCISIVPISITTMIIGATLNYHSEKLALMLLINTVAGMFYIPIALMFYQSDWMQQFFFSSIQV